MGVVHHGRVPAVPRGGAGRVPAGDRPPVPRGAGRGRRLRRAGGGGAATCPAALRRRGRRARRGWRRRRGRRSRSRTCSPPAGRPSATAVTVHGCGDPDGRPARLPSWLRTAPVADGRPVDIGHGFRIARRGSPPISPATPTTHTTPPDELQRRLIAETAALGPASGMQISPHPGRVHGAARAGHRRPAGARGRHVHRATRRCAWPARLPDDGHLLCCDVSEEWTAIGRRYWDEAGVGHKIDLRIGPAVDTLRALPAGEQFDLAFVDADKSGYPRLLRRDRAPAAAGRPDHRRQHDLGPARVADPTRHRRRTPWPCARSTTRWPPTTALRVRAAADRRRPHAPAEALTPPRRCNAAACRASTDRPSEASRRRGGAAGLRELAVPSPGRRRAGRRSPSPGTRPGASRGTTSRPHGRRRCGRAPGWRASRRGAPPSGGRHPACATSSGATAPRSPAPCSRRSRRPAPAPPGAARRPGARCARARRRAPPGRRTPGPCTPTPGLLRCRRRGAGTTTTPPRARCRGGRRRSRSGRLRRQADVHRQRHRDAHADGGAVDGGDHGLRRLEDAQRHEAAAVARHALVAGRLATAAPAERLAAARQVGAGAEAAAPAGDDHGPHVVVGVGAIERVDHLAHHRAGEGVEHARAGRG